jgi:hypothetical protein
LRLYDATGLRLITGCGVRGRDPGEECDAFVLCEVRESVEMEIEIDVDED